MSYVMYSNVYIQSFMLRQEGEGHTKYKPPEMLEREAVKTHCYIVCVCN